MHPDKTEYSQPYKATHPALPVCVITKPDSDGIVKVNFHYKYLERVKNRDHYLPVKDGKGTKVLRGIVPINI